MPAAAAWLLIGAGLTALPLSGAALIGAVAYAAYYGVTEAAALPGLAPPGRGWQVPQSLVAGVPPGRKALIWGALLGPGLATRNPYAGFGLLPLAVAAMPRLAAGLALGAAIGLAHGTARAAALLRDLRRSATWHLELALRTLRWRRLDGCLLLVIAAAAAAEIAARLR